MKICRLHRPHLLGAAAFVLSALPAFSQTVELTALAPFQSAPVYGEQYILPEVPVPEWKEESGIPVARLQLKAAEAAGWRIEFRTLSLGKGGQTFLYGMDTNGGSRAAHGPYE